MEKEITDLYNHQEKILVENSEMLEEFSFRANENLKDCRREYDDFKVGVEGEVLKWRDLYNGCLKEGRTAEGMLEEKEEATNNTSSIPLKLMVNKEAEIYEESPAPVVSNQDEQNNINYNFDIKKIDNFYGYSDEGDQEYGNALSDWFPAYFD